MSSIRHRSRIAAPAIRRGWLRDGPGPSPRRGADEFVRLSWAELTELLANELRRVVDAHGNEAIYGGSYGWASAGRFHHAQSQIHRFLKFLGGYTFSRHSYSLGATGVIVPRVVGTHDDLFERSTEWDVIVEHTDLLVCFGGVALKNTGTNAGGTTTRPARDALRRFRDQGGTIERIRAPTASLRLGCTASSTAAQRVSRRKCKDANRSGCIRPMPPRGVWLAAT